MRRSSPLQQQFEFSGSNTAPEAEPANQPLGVSEAAPSDAGSTLFKLPSFDTPNDYVALTARRAGRQNAARITDQERDALLRERQSLLNKDFDGTITHAESNRLEYVRWSLDRIEDARQGEQLDALENMIAQYEQFESRVQELAISLAEHLPKSKKRRRK